MVVLVCLPGAPVTQSLIHSTTIHCRPAPHPAMPQSIWALRVGWATCLLAQLCSWQVSSLLITLTRGSVVKLWQGGQLGCHLCLQGSWHLGQTSEVCRCVEGHVNHHSSSQSTPLHLSSFDHQASHFHHPGKFPHVPSHSYTAPYQ